jgi:hypothetical protein
MKSKSAASDVKIDRETSPTVVLDEVALASASVPKACSILDPGCESCQ